MAVGMMCTPIIREELVRLQQADVIHELEAGQLVREAAGSSARKPFAGPGTTARQKPSLRHRLLHPVHSH